jgi:hypothetical protein
VLELAMVLMLDCASHQLATLSELTWAHLWESTKVLTLGCGLRQLAKMSEATTGPTLDRASHQPAKVLEMMSAFLWMVPKLGHASRQLGGTLVTTLAL